MKRKKASKSSGGGSSAGPDIEQIEKLLKTMSEHNLEEFEYSRGELRIRLKKPSAGALHGAPRTAAMPEIIVAGTSPVAGTAASEPQEVGGHRHVQQNSGSQPRGDCPASDLRVQRAGNLDRSRIFGGGS